MQSFLYDIIKIIVYFLIILSGLGTILIPTFFSSKMIKQSRNFVSGLSVFRRLSFLTSLGRLFVLCAFLSIVLGITIAKLDNKESGFEQQRDFSNKIQLIDSLNNLRMETQNLLNKERLDAKEREASIRDSLSDLKNLTQVKKVEDSVRSVKALLSEKSFQYDALSAELKLATNEKIMLEREFKSPRIDFA